MDRVGEEEEEELQTDDQDDGDGATVGGHDEPPEGAVRQSPAYRDRQVANQKARIVSQMTPRSKAAAASASKPSPRKPTLGPTKTLPAQPAVSTERVMGGSANSKAHAPLTGSASYPQHAPTGKVSLFDVVAHTLEGAFDSDNFRSPRESPRPFCCLGAIALILCSRIRRSACRTASLRCVLVGLLHQIWDGLRNDGRDRQCAFQRFIVFGLGAGETVSATSHCMARRGFGRCRVCGRVE